jgi:catechol 2,3-dioxygenase-like lactoylglutathione lyase family enzyme
VGFYRDLLGLRLIHRQENITPYTSALVGYADAHLRIAQFAIPGVAGGATRSGHQLELVEYASPRMAPLPPERARAGSSHLAFSVSDIDKEYGRLLASGVEFVSAPNAITAGINKGGACCYFVDPDGFTLELVQPPAAHAPSAPGSETT